MQSTPLDAYPTAYDALEGTPVEYDHEVRSAIAKQIVDTLMQLRKDRGLNYLRNIGCGSAYYNEARRVSLQFGRDADLITGRVALHKAYEATAQVIVAAFARPRSNRGQS